MSLQRKSTTHVGLSKSKFRSKHLDQMAQTPNYLIALHPKKSAQSECARMCVCVCVCVCVCMYLRVCLGVLAKTEAT